MVGRCSDDWNKPQPALENPVRRKVRLGLSVMIGESWFDVTVAEPAQAVLEAYAA